MGKRVKQRKNLNVIKNLMDELSLSDGSSTKKTDNNKVSPFSATATTTKHFVLAPSHPFYWHLSNRENRPKDAEKSSLSEYPDSGSQSVGKVVIKKVKSLKRRHKIKRNKKNKTKTQDLNVCNHSNTSRPLGSDKINRKQAKRAAKRLKSQKVKRRLVNKTLANGLNQLSIL